MSKKYNGEDLVAIVDYKTGSISTNINNLKYGLSMQLPIYLYLVSNSGIYNNPKIVGIYLQKVLNGKLKYDSKKDINMIVKDNLKLSGYTVDDEDILYEFDKTYENSELIKGIKKLKSGKMDSRSKVISNGLFKSINNYTEEKINFAIDKILDGDFEINPKVINKENVSCKYCKFNDICYKSNEDIEYLDSVSDLSYLEGDNNEMD